MPEPFSVRSSSYTLAHFQADRLQQGDQQVFGKLYDQYAPLLLGVIRSMVRDEKIAAEILHASFVEIWSHFKVRRSDGPLYTPMLKIVRKHASGYPFESRESTSIPVEHTAADLQNCAIFDLVYRQGVSFETAAIQLNMPVETLRIRFRNEMKQHFTNNQGSK